MVRDQLGISGLSVESIHRVVCTRGPGGYTGIRVALAFAQGLRRATGAEIFAYSTFEVLRFLADQETGACSIVGAGKREVLVQLGKEPSWEKAHVIKHSLLSQFLETHSVTKVVAAPNLDLELEEIVKVEFASDNISLPLFQLFQRKKGEGSMLTPLYGREFARGL